MGLGGGSVKGLAGIDDCVHPSSCEAFCGGPSCNGGQFFCSYTPFTECGSRQCPFHSDLPHAGNCGDILRFDALCQTSGGINVTLWECGPSADAQRVGYCFDTGRDPGVRRVVSCINVKTFQSLCGGCNPFTYGFMEVKIS